MNFIKNFSFQKLFSNRKFMIAFSVITAFAIWLVITTEQNPTRTATISGVTVNIDVSNSVAGSMGLDIVSNDYPKTVTVSVQGPNYIVSSLKADDIIVNADMSQVFQNGAGTYDLKLNAERNSSSIGYSVIGVSPETISVTFDYMNTKEFTVIPKADGIRASSGLITDVASVSSAGASSIVIRGSKTEVDKVDSVVALVDATEVLEATKTYDANIILYDAEGNILDNSKFTLSAEKVKVTVPICRQKVLPVTAMFSNEPYSGAGLSLVSGLSVRTVTVIGTPATVDELENVELAKIDFREISIENDSFDVSFSLPEGVRVQDGLEYVTVSLDLSGYKSSTFAVNEKNVSFVNVSEGLSASATTAIKNVVICGPSALVNSLQNEELFAEVDLSGKAAGEYTVNAAVKCRTSDRVWQVGTSTVTVSIR